LTSNETGRRVKRPLGEVLRERYAEITAMDRAIGTLRDYLNNKGLRGNTLLWYCGDNGTPPSGVLASPLRGMKGQVYEGGTRVPAVIEWPAHITTPRKIETNVVTSDMLPTLCALAGMPTPDDRPLDGINIAAFLEGSRGERTAPIFFWSFGNRQRLGGDPKPWIDPKWQEGTTPLVKFLGGIRTRNFRNYHHPDIAESDYQGARAMLGNRYKLIIHDEKGRDPEVELFDLRADPAEQTNLAVSEPEIVSTMQAELRNWQHSVLQSLTGADYGN
jgi:arylsulfatase A-like enzyme